MKNEQRNIFKLDEEVLKHASPIKHNWSMNNTSKNYGKATNTQYGHVIVNTNLNTSSTNQAINQLIKKKAIKNHTSGTTDYSIATDSQYSHVKVDTELKNSTNPIRNSLIYSAINDIFFVSRM